MNNFDFRFKKLCPFKWYVLENFPFIEETINAITEYDLYCKLCEYLNKTIDELNAIGEQTENLTSAFEELQNYVNNYFATLDIQEEINVKLNDMVEDGTLARIINEEVFAELNKKISNDVEYHFIKTGELQGDCTLIKTKTKAFLYDLSMNTNYQNITTYLSLEGISHIDGIIISHFHYDHVGGNQAQGFIGLVNSSYVDETTQVYIPTTPDFTKFVNDPATSASDVVARVNEMMAYVINACNARGLQINYMSTNDTLIVDNLKIRFLNCSEEEYENYYNILQSFDDGLHYCTTYNNFSMVLECSNINNTTLLTGDIEEKAEEILAPFINRKITLKKLEHHGVNRLSNSAYLVKTNSDVNVVMNGQNDVPMATMRASYGYIFMTGKKIYSTIENTSMKFYDNGNGLYSERQLIEKKFQYMSIIAGLTGIGAGGLKNLNVASYTNVIEKNTDLDNFIIPGDYDCFNAETSATVQNQPNSNYGAFKLTVEQTTNVERYIQRIVYNRNQYTEYVRTYTGTWSAWERIKTEQYIQTRFENNITIEDTNYHTIPTNSHIETPAFEISGNKIICRKTGTYIINANICVGGSSLEQNDRIVLAVARNGDNIFVQQQDVNGTQQTLTIAGFIYTFTANDEITFSYRNLTGARGIVIANQCFMSIHN